MPAKCSAADFWIGKKTMRNEEEERVEEIFVSIVRYI